MSIVLDSLWRWLGKHARIPFAAQRQGRSFFLNTLSFDHFFILITIHNLTAYYFISPITMVYSPPLSAAIVAIVPLSQSAGPLLASAFTTSHFSRPISPVLPHPATPTWTLAAGKGFGDKPAPAKPKSSPPPSPSTIETTEDSSAPLNAGQENKGSTLLQQLRSREAEKKDEELRKLRELRETDALLAEDAGAAAIPERVAQRMGKRMLPFVGIPLFGSFATFIAFWYLATYKDLEFQPAVVAGTSALFLAIGLFVSSPSFDKVCCINSFVGIDIPIANDAVYITF